TFPAAEVDDHRLAELMTGSRIEHRVLARAVAAPPALEVRNATRRGEFTDVSLTLHRGEILGLIRLLGAGRTELAMSLFGMARLERAEILVESRPVKLPSNRDSAAAGIAYVSEDRLSLGLNLRQSIADNVAITVLDKLPRRYGLISPRERGRMADGWIARL